MEDMNLTVSELVFVTANSWTHFPESLDGVASVQHHYPGARILYFDWGLRKNQIQMLNSLCNVTVRPFKVSFLSQSDFENTSIQFQVLKPIVIALVLKEYPGLVYFDASVRFRNNLLAKTLPQARANGGILMFSLILDTIFSTTHKYMYKYLPTNLAKAKKVRTVQSGILLVYNTSAVVVLVQPGP
jgi:hypothetical protein